MLVDPSLLGNVLPVAMAIGGAFLVALWISLVIWAYRDMRRRSRHPLARIASALLVVVPNLPGVIIYLLLRPSRTEDDEYEHALKEESLLRALEEPPQCPGCERRVSEDWVLCPDCHTMLRKSCHNCSRLMELPWNICPYCGVPVPQLRSAAVDLGEALRELQLDDAQEQSSAA
jgi:RNA polymerase subunit RPABC4/transcription elongation factor Spt4